MAFEQEDKRLAESVFRSIRDIPYRLPEYPGDEAPQCAYKSLRLVSELGRLGIKARTQIGEMDWQQTLFPERITDLYPADIIATHMYVEIFDSGTWRPLDASWDKALGKAGFPTAEFDGMNSPGLPLLKIYDENEQAECLAYWSAPGHVEDYFSRAAGFMKAANRWLVEIRPE